MKIKEKLLLTMSAIAISFTIILSIGIPNQSQAFLGSEQWLGTTCQEIGGDSWRCNDCTTGTKNCNDNSCVNCQPAPTIEQ